MAPLVLRSLSTPVFIALAYYLGAKLGFALTLAPVPVSTLWPPNAILLASLALVPAASWPMVLASVFVAHMAVQFQTGVPPAMVLSWYVSNCTEALLGAMVVRRFGRGVRTFETFQGTAIFFVLVGVATPFVTSFLDAGLVTANRWGAAGYWSVFRTRFLANVLAAITIVPFILTTAEAVRRFREIPARMLVEAGAGFVMLLATCAMLFVYQAPGPSTSAALLYTPVPFLVAAAVRFGPWGASTSILTCALVAIWGATLGQGPFVGSSSGENALAIQLFLIIAWVPVMALAAIVRERARAEAKARQSEQQLMAAIEAAQLGRWDWDLNTQRLRWSDITRRMFEVPLDVAATPALFDTIVHPDDKPAIAKAAEDCASGREVDVEYRVQCAGGRVKWVYTKGRIVPDDNGRPARMVGVNVDVTERKLAEMALRCRQRELAQQAHVSVAGELSIALAHEVNQPLAAILANAGAARRYLLHDPPDLSELGAIVAAIADDNRRAAAVITRFGDLKRKGEAPLEALAMNSLIESVVDIARGDILSRGVSLTTSLADDLPVILGDSVQIQQVVLNLIINACDALESTPADGRRVVVATFRNGAGGVSVTVTDTGPGIAAERRDQIFEPFVTTKPRRLGLGLAICRSIVSEHNGALWLDGTGDSGATFCFSLPGHH